MLIGQLVKEIGLSKDTIRFYEKQGLIVVSNKERRQNNYKEYSGEVLAKLTTIKRLKNFGFTLNEISELLEMIESNEATCKNVENKISQKVLLLDNKILEMIAIRQMLISGVQECKNGCTSNLPEKNCPILITKN